MPTSVIVWLGAAAVAASLPIAWWAVSGESGKVSQRVAQNLGSYEPTTLREAELERSAAERFLSPVTGGVGSKALRFTPVGWINTQVTALAKAGLTGRVTPEQVLGAKLILPLVVGGLLSLRLFSQWSVSGLLLVIFFAVFGFFAPDLLLRARADRRADEITLELPDVLDQLTVLVEAGLGFEAALARIIQASGGGPLATEFGRMLQDIQFGTRRVEALDAVAKRSQVDDLKSVVLALRQAESLGVPLAGTLRGLAVEMREKRKFRAEEKAYKLPVKMIFPLGLCILPALVVVIIGPAIIRFTQIF